MVDNSRMLAFYDRETAAFPALLSVGGDVVISGNAARELDGFHQLRRIGANAGSPVSPGGIDGGGNLIISDSPALQSLTRETPVTILGVLLEASPSPPPLLRAFGSLEAVRGAVEISRNDGLRTIRGALRRLMYVSREIRVRNNPLLQLIASSFSLLDSVGTGLYVVENPSLAKISKCFLVLRVVGGDMQLSGNIALIAMDAGTLNGLIQVGAHLTNCDRVAAIQKAPEEVVASEHEGAIYVQCGRDDHITISTLRHFSV